MFKRLFESKHIETISNEEVEKRMAAENGEKFGESEYILLYGGFQELNEYYFFEALFLSVDALKSKSGAKITFKSNNGDLTLNASMVEFESEYSKRIERNATQISFDIDKDQIKKIQEGEYDSIQLKVKKKIFTLLKS